MILLSNKKEHVTTTWKNINKSQKHTDRQLTEMNTYFMSLLI